MLHLKTGYWGDLSLDGKRYFVVAGLRVQHEDKVMLVPFFIPVVKKKLDLWSRKKCFS